MTLQERLGIELPIIQAPMAGVQGSALAVAVSNAGGLGSLPCAMLDVDTIRKEVAAIQAQTSKPYNLNFFCHTPPEPDEVQEDEDHRPGEGGDGVGDAGAQRAGQHVSVEGRAGEDSAGGAAH